MFIGSFHSQTIEKVATLLPIAEKFRQVGQATILSTMEFSQKCEEKLRQI